MICDWERLRENGTDRARRIWLDRLGMTLSGACAVHCAVMPLLTGILAASGLFWIASEELERMILFSSIAIAAISLIPSYRRHRHALPLACFGFGAICLFSAHAIPASAGWRWIASPGMVLGGVGLVLAHALNLTKNHSLKRHSNGKC